MSMKPQTNPSHGRQAAQRRGGVGQRFSLTVLASAMLLSSGGAFAAPGVPQLDKYAIDSTPHAFVQIDTGNAGTGSYKDAVKRNEVVPVALPFQINWSATPAVKAVAVIDGVVDPASEISLSDGNQKGSVVTVAKTAGKKKMQVRVFDADGAYTDSLPHEVVLFDTTPEFAADLPDNSYPKNKKFVQANNGVVGTYYTTWSQYKSGRNYPVDKIPLDNLTHILYGFVPVCGDHINEGVQNMESYPALVKTCKGMPDFSVAIHDQWGEFGSQLMGEGWNAPIKGVLHQMMAAKKRNPDLKILPSIGGWTLSDPFYRMHDPANRKIFIDSVEEFLHTWKFFDGVDIDWEFPGGNGATPGMGNKETDGELYVTLMKELREMLDRLEVKYGKTYQLTSAIGSPPEKVNVVDYKKATQYMDYLFDMTYDFHGAFDLNKLGHLTSLYAPQGGPETEFTTHNSVEALLAQGVDPKKIVIGVAKYGRGWTGVHGYKDGNPFTGKATGPHRGTFEPGIMGYNKIVDELLGPDHRGINGYEYHYDESAEGPYVFNKSTGALMTFDDPRSTLAKGRYARERQLGGLFSWEINGDNGEILNAMNEGLGKKERGGSEHYAPVARAIPKVTVQGAQSVRLDASGSSHPNGAALTFKWQQISGKTLTVKNGSNAIAMVDVPDVDQTTQYGFRVTVTEPSGLSATATTMITAEPKQQSENHPPVARLTGPASVEAGQSVTLSAASSTDPDGDKLSFTWVVPQGIQATHNGATLNFIAPELDKDTSYTVAVKVSDGKLTATANHTIVVKAKKSGGENLPPVARLTGPDSAEAGQTVTLSAAGSTDPDGDKLSFTWTVPQGIQAVRNGDTLEFVAPTLKKDTSYTIAVKVSDGKLSATASHTIVVKAKQSGGENLPPVARLTGPANADAGQSVTLSAAGSTDPDGDKLSFAWTVPQGLRATPNGATLNFVAPELEKDTPFTIVVRVSDGKLTATANHTIIVKAKSQEQTDDYPVYKAGTQYKAGDIVLNDGSLYQCKPFPYSGWCSLAPHAYEPGKGSAWSDAWNLYRQGEEGGGKKEDDNTYPLYKEGTQYKSGDIVTNGGKLFRCKPFPFGGWCSQSGWAYEPGKGTVWNDAWEEYKR
ncbi:hypothetical protein MyNCGM683_21510 [Achromobacter xylosoxidans]